MCKPESEQPNNRRVRGGQGTRAGRVEAQGGVEDVRPTRFGEWEARRATDKISRAADGKRFGGCQLELRAAGARGGSWDWGGGRGEGGAARFCHWVGSKVTSLLLFWAH